MSDRDTRVGTFDGTCCWCSNPADSDEDVIPKWVNAEMPRQEGWPAGCKPTFSHLRDGVVKTRTAQTLTPKMARTRAVCERCNNEWMSRQERRVVPIMGPLIRGHQRLLSAADQVEIALWACIKGGICDTRPLSADGGLMSEASRRAVVEGRPPSDMLVRVAAYEVAYDLGVHTQYGAGMKAGGTALALWATTIVLGHLVVQVVGRTGSSRPPVLQGLPSGVHDGRSFTVWPPQLGSVQWPPPLVLGRAELGPFLTEMLPGIEHDPRSLPSYSNPCRVCGRTHGPLTRRLPVVQPPRRGPDD